MRLAWHTSRATPPTTWYLHLARRRAHALACLHPSLALTLGALCVYTAGQHSGTLRGHSRDKHAAHARELQDGGQCVEQHPCRAPPAVCAGVAAQRPLCDAGTKLIKHQLWQSRRCANVLEVSVLLTTARRSTAGPKGIPSANQPTVRQECRYEPGRLRMKIEKASARVVRHRPRLHYRLLTLCPAAY